MGSELLEGRAGRAGAELGGAGVSRAGSSGGLWGNGRAGHLRDGDKPST